MTKISKSNTGIVLLKDECNKFIRMKCIQSLDSGTNNNGNNRGFAFEICSRTLIQF